MSTLVLIGAGALSAAAQSTDIADTDDRWVVRIAPYLWATSLDGKIADRHGRSRS